MRRMKFPDIIAFINPKSGGKHGAKIHLKLCILLGDDHVFDLSQGGPETGYVSLTDIPLSDCVLSALNTIH